MLTRAPLSSSLSVDFGLVLASDGALGYREPPFTTVALFMQLLLLLLQEPARKRRAAGQRRQENILTVTVSCDLGAWLCGLDSVYLSPLPP